MDQIQLKILTPTKQSIGKQVAEPNPDVTWLVNNLWHNNLNKMKTVDPYDNVQT